MKKDIIVNGRKMAEVGNTIDFVVFHSNRPNGEQEKPKQYTMTEEDRQRYINKMLEETKLKQKKEQTKRTIPKNEIRAFDRLINQVADYQLTYSCEVHKDE